MTLNDVRLPSLHFSWKEAPSSTSPAGRLVNTASSQLHGELCKDPCAIWHFFNRTTGRRTLLQYLETTRICSLGPVTLWEPVTRGGFSGLIPRKQDFALPNVGRSPDDLRHICRRVTMSRLFSPVKILIVRAFVSKSAANKPSTLNKEEVCNSVQHAWRVQYNMHATRTRNYPR